MGSTGISSHQIHLVLGQPSFAAVEAVFPIGIILIQEADFLGLQVFHHILGQDAGLVVIEGIDGKEIGIVRLYIFLDAGGRADPDDLVLFQIIPEPPIRVRRLPRPQRQRCRFFSTSSLTTVLVWAGLYMSSRRKYLIFRPWMPPSSLTIWKSSPLPRATDPQGAAGPVWGPHWPMRISLSSNPGGLA